MITPKGRERRRRYICSSDVAAILVLDPWSNDRDVWFEKVHGVDRPENKAMQRGNFLEDSVLRWAAAELNVQLRRNVWRVMPGGLCAASLDAVVQSANLRGDILEGKTSTEHEAWGSEGTDEIPVNALVQCHWQLGVTGAETCWVPALIADPWSLRFRMYKVDADEGVFREIQDKCVAWWQRYVVPKVQPTGEPPHLETLRYLRRRPETTVPLDPWLYEAYDMARGAASAAETQLKGVKAHLLAALGDAEAGVLPDGAQVTYIPDKRGVPSLRFKKARSD